MTFSMSNIFCLMLSSTLHERSKESANLKEIQLLASILFHLLEQINLTTRSGCGGIFLMSNFWSFGFIGRYMHLFSHIKAGVCIAVVVFL